LPFRDHKRKPEMLFWIIKELGFGIIKENKNQNCLYKVQVSDGIAFTDPERDLELPF
jgi:hypothetical protein